MVNRQVKAATDVKVQDQNNIDLLLDIRCTIHFECVPKGVTVSQTLNVEVLKRFADAMKRSSEEDCDEIAN